MQRIMINIALIIALCMVPSCGWAAEDALFNKFENPPAEAKPFVRWWWGDNAVVEKEILREIDVMDEAGIGGYEINPIAAPVGISEISQSVDITGRVKDGKLTVEVPAGIHIIHVGLVQEGFREVFMGSLGAKGPVLDHYNAEALESFLK